MEENKKGIPMHVRAQFNRNQRLRYEMEKKHAEGNPVAALLMMSRQAAIEKIDADMQSFPSTLEKLIALKSLLVNIKDETRPNPNYNVRAYYESGKRSAQAVRQHIEQYIQTLTDMLEIEKLSAGLTPTNTSLETLPQHEVKSGLVRESGKTSAEVFMHDGYTYTLPARLVKLVAGSTRPELLDQIKQLCIDMLTPDEPHIINHKGQLMRISVSPLEEWRKRKRQIIDAFPEIEKALSEAIHHIASSADGHFDTPQYKSHKLYIDSFCGRLLPSTPTAAFTNLLPKVSPLPNIPEGRHGLKDVFRDVVVKQKLMDALLNWKHEGLSRVTRTSSGGHVLAFGKGSLALLGALAIICREKGWLKPAAKPIDLAKAFCEEFSVPMPAGRPKQFEIGFAQTGDASKYLKLLAFVEKI
jgi:hypothetical protein